MRELIAAGAHVNARMEDGMSVLHEVFAQPPSRQRPEGAKRDMFRMLVAAGADVNNRTPERSYTGGWAGGQAAPPWPAVLAGRRACAGHAPCMCRAG